MIRIFCQQRPIIETNALIKGSLAKTLLPRSIFASRLCSTTTQDTSLSEAIKPERVEDLSKGTSWLRTKGRLPYTVWKEVHQILQPNGFKWDPKERWWIGESGPLSSDALLKAEDYLLEVMFDMEKISAEDMEKSEQKWIESEDAFLAKNQPVIKAIIEDSLEASSLNLISSEDKEKQLNQLLDDVIEKSIAFVPSGINKKRFTHILRAALVNIEELTSFDLKSVQKAAFTASALGLEPDSVLQEGFFIPFKNKLHFILGYRGLMALSSRAEEVLFFDAKCVYKNDLFHLVSPPNTMLAHIPHPDPEERGPMTQVYSMRVRKNGEKDIFVLSAKDIKKYQSMSKSAQGKSSPWRTWPEEMALKSAIKGLSKKTELSAELRKDD